MSSGKFQLALAVLALLFGVSSAMAAESTYLKFNFDKDCTSKPPGSVKNFGMGSSAFCNFDNNPPLYFLQGELRQSAGFGAPGKYQSFGQYNSMSTTIEWRSNGARPYAAIVRFSIYASIDEIIAKNKSREGQVLVVHRVAAGPDDLTCIVGMVDARANKNANVIARQIADEIADGFKCGIDRPNYFGEKGEFAGDLM